MDLKIHPGGCFGTVEIYPSKSLSHRYLVCAGLTKGVSILENLKYSNDIDDTIYALSSFNVTIDGNKIDGSNLELKSNQIHLRESGTSLRFMIPFALLFHDEVFFYGEGRLDQRPLDVYKEAFSQKAVKFEYLGDHYLPLKVRGKLKGGYYQLRGDISSQFISGLMMVLPTLKADSVIEITGQIESKSYIDLTKDVLKDFGVEVIEVLPFYYIKGNQTFKPVTKNIEGDYSHAANFMLLGLMHGNIRIKGLNPNSLQGDKMMIDILRKMGGDLSFKDDMLSMNKSNLKSTFIDLSQIPDLGPILFVAASISKGVSEFTHYDRLRLKESDRIEAMIENLKNLGVEIEVTPKKIKIKGKEKILGGQKLNGFKDHRVIMALTVLSTVCECANQISNTEYIEKSYPEFFDSIKKLGGKIDYEV